MKFYGNDIETFVVTKDGRVWIIQSPDLVGKESPGDIEEISKLPPDAHELDPILCQELDVSGIPVGEKE